MPALPEVLGALARVCASLSLRWYLFGAQAAIVHGSSRLSADVDATVELGDRPAAGLVARMQEAGFRLRVSDAEDFIKRTRVLPFVHEATGMPVDLVLAGPGLEERFLDRARSQPIGGVAVPTACAEDLVAMKILAGRPKDLEDVVAVLAAQGQVMNLQLVRETLGHLESALGQSDLTPAFEAALTRSRTG
jgi:hypothetical protein